MVISLSSEVFIDREKNYIKKLFFSRVTSTHTHTHTHLKSWASLCPSSVVTSLPISMSTLLATSTVGTTDAHQIVCSSYKHTHSVYAVKLLDKVAHVRTAFQWSLGGDSYCSGTTQRTFGQIVFTLPVLPKLFLVWSMSFLSPGISRKLILCVTEYKRRKPSAQRIDDSSEAIEFSWR